MHGKQTSVIGELNTFLWTVYVHSLDVYCMCLLCVGYIPSAIYGMKVWGTDTDTDTLTITIAHTIWVLIHTYAHTYVKCTLYNPILKPN